MSALSPANALAYLGELSTDIVSCAVFDRQGNTLAGDPAVTVRAAPLLARSSEPEVRSQERDGTLYAAGADDVAVAVVVGALALEDLVLYDLRGVLLDLTDGE